MSGKFIPNKIKENGQKKKFAFNLIEKLFNPISSLAKSKHTDTHPANNLFRYFILKLTWVHFIYLKWDQAASIQPNKILLFCLCEFFFCCCLSFIFFFCCIHQNTRDILILNMFRVIQLFLLFISFRYVLVHSY